jgi:hypothetical protein
MGIMRFLPALQGDLTYYSLLTSVSSSFQLLVYGPKLLHWNAYKYFLGSTSCFHSVCVCVCAHQHRHIKTHKYTQIHTSGAGRSDFLKKSFSKIEGQEASCSTGNDPYCLFHSIYAAIS